MKSYVPIAQLFISKVLVLFYNRLIILQYYILLSFLDSGLKFCTAISKFGNIALSYESSLLRVKNKFASKLRIVPTDKFRFLLVCLNFNCLTRSWRKLKANQFVVSEIGAIP